MAEAAEASKRTLYEMLPERQQKMDAAARRGKGSISATSTWRTASRWS